MSFNRKDTLVNKKLYYIAKVRRTFPSYLQILQSKTQERQKCTGGCKQQRTIMQTQSAEILDQLEICNWNSLHLFTWISSVDPHFRRAFPPFSSENCHLHPGQEKLPAKHTWDVSDEPSFGDGLSRGNLYQGSETKTNLRTLTFAHRTCSEGHWQVCKSYFQNDA